MFVVDTNILIYAANPEAAEHSAAYELVERWRLGDTPWHLTWGIVYEFLRVITHRRVFRRPWTAAEGIAFVEALLAAPGLIVLTPTARHGAILASVLRDTPRVSGNLFFDCQTATLMREHGVRTILTHDADFHRFRFLEVSDPLA